MSDNADPAAAAAEEIASLKAEVARLRAALDAHALAAQQRHGHLRSPMKVDPDLPGLGGIWRGERGLAWQLFVQAVLTIIAALAVIAMVTIAGA
jgi:hypothetical protein